jgi:hypothetical protein
VFSLLPFKVFHRILPSVGDNFGGMHVIMNNELRYVDLIRDRFSSSTVYALFYNILPKCRM